MKMSWLLLEVRGNYEGHFTVRDVIPHLPQPQVLSRCLISGSVQPRVL